MFNIEYLQRNQDINQLGISSQTKITMASYYFLSRRMGF